MAQDQTQLQGNGKDRPTHYIIYKHRIIPVAAEVKNGVLVQGQTGLPIPEPSGLPITPEDTPYTLAEKMAAHTQDVHRPLQAYRDADAALRSKYKRRFSDIDRETQPDEHAKLKTGYATEHAAIPAPGEKPRVIPAPKKTKPLYEILSDPLPVLTREEMQLLSTEQSISFLTKQQEFQIIRDLMELRPKAMSRNQDAERYINNQLAYYVQEGDVASFTKMLSGNSGRIIYDMAPNYLWVADGMSPFVDAIVTCAPALGRNMENSVLLRQLGQWAFNRNDVALIDRLDPKRESFDNRGTFHIAMSNLDFALRNNDRALLDKPGFQEDVMKIIRAPENQSLLAEALTYKRNIRMTEMFDPDRTHLQRYFDSDKRSWVSRCSRPEAEEQHGRRHASEMVLEYAIVMDDQKLLALIDPERELVGGSAGARIREKLAPKVSKAGAQEPREKYYKDIGIPHAIEVPQAAHHTEHPGFSRQVYEAVYKPIATAYVIEGADNAQEAACKLALLFETPDTALEFLRRRVEEKKKSKQPVHDALMISVPAGNEWHPKAWGKLLMAQGSGALDYLSLAPEIEKQIEISNNQLQGQRQFSVEKLKVKELERLSAEIEYPDSELDPEWTSTCQKMKPHVSRNGYLRGLDARKNIAKEDHIPDIGIIDGAAFGFPGYYMAKVPKNDPRLLVMGMLVDCCNHVDGETADMAVAAVTDPDGGCYALFKKSGNAPDMKNDRIMGKVSVFRGDMRRSTDARPYTDLVFNSWERVHVLTGVNDTSGKNIGEVFLAKAADAAIESAGKTKGMELIGNVNLGRNRDEFRSFARVNDPVRPRSAATASIDASTQYRVASSKLIQAQRVVSPGSPWASVAPAQGSYGYTGSAL
jgi:hypothetical protein